MRIVDRATFIALPARTVYQKYKPCIFGPINIKLDSVQDFDWFELCGVDQPDFPENNDTGAWVACCDEMEHGGSLPMVFETITRDGCFDKDQLFAVWEDADVLGLIGVLQGTLAK